MSGHSLILIRDDAAAGDAAVAQARQVLDAHPATRKLGVRTVTIAEAIDDPGRLDPGQVAWVIAGRAGVGELFEVIGALQDRHLPVLLTHAAERDAAALQQDGVALCPPADVPGAAAAMIAAMRSQAPVLRAMRAELKLLRAHQGSLGDQIGRIDEELRLAAQLQREFLPKSMVGIGSVGFRVLFRPAGYVSGDIYDVIRLDEKHIGFFIADAVGHGVPAALLTMYIKRSLVTKRIDPASRGGYRLTEPAEALAKLNRDLVEQQSGQVRFATACYGVVDCETFEVCLARAGHPFPILLRGDGRSETLEPEGGLLGVFAEEAYEQVKVRLEPGDRLLLYSDGFEMAFPSEKQAAPDPAGRRRRVASTRYLEEFESLRHGCVDEALLRMQEKLDHQAGSLNQRDDLTLVCLAVAPASDRLADAPAVPAAAAAN